MAAQGGCAASFSELVRRHEAPLYRFLVMRTRDPEQAEAPHLDPVAEGGVGMGHHGFARAGQPDPIVRHEVRRPLHQLRPVEEEEREGLDIADHGERAYNY